jgi:hypothetical protein
MKKPVLDHIGIAVRSIEEASVYQALGLSVDHVEAVESQGVKTAFLSVGDANLEVLEPLSPESASTESRLSNSSTSKPNALSPWLSATLLWRSKEARCKPRIRRPFRSTISPRGAPPTLPPF